MTKENRVVILFSFHEVAYQPSGSITDECACTDTKHNATSAHSSMQSPYVWVASPFHSTNEAPRSWCARLRFLRC